MLNNKQNGLSLIEIMIALVIGLMLVAGAVQLFISNKATYRVESALSRLQETGRFIVDIMAKEIRMTGYTGCLSRGDVEPNNIAIAPAPYQLIPANALRGSQSTGTSTWSPALPGMLTGAYAPWAGTDTITIQRAHECSVSVTATVDNGDASSNISIESPNACGFQQTSPVIITDCANADIFQIDNSSPTTTVSHDNANGNNNATTAELGSSYATDAIFSRLLSKTFFVAPSSADANEPALWMANWVPNNDGTMNTNDFTMLEYAEGVEDIQLQFGLDTGGADVYADTYVDANDAALTDWTAVRSVRVFLLLRSEDNITTAPRGILFRGATVNNPSGTSPDRRLRMVYTSTISLRNRLP